MSGSGKRNLVGFVRGELKRIGLQSSIFPVKYVPLLYRDLRSRVTSGEIDPSLVERYLYPFVANSPEIPEWANSVVLVSMGRAIARVRFILPRGAKWVIIPPQYRRNQEVSVAEFLGRILEPLGLGAVKAEIPLKLAAARSFLGEYGRNNLLYTKENGSFLRLVAFYSNLDCGEALWREESLMEACAGCGACLKHCPTSCIVKERFVIEGERCLAFHNESVLPFPEWIDPNGFNSLIGCMRCQSICPANRAFLYRIETWDTFSRDETETIIGSSEAGEIPENIARRFDRMGIVHYLPVLGRNLRFLICR